MIVLEKRKSNRREFDARFLCRCKAKSRIKGTPPKRKLDLAFLFLSGVVSIWFAGCAVTVERNQAVRYPGALVYSPMPVSRFFPCAIDDPVINAGGIPLLSNDRLEKFAQERGIPLCHSCGYHLECIGAIVQTHSEAGNGLGFRLDQVLELRESRPDDCEVNPRQD